MFSVGVASFSVGTCRRWLMSLWMSGWWIGWSAGRASACRVGGVGEWAGSGWAGLVLRDKTWLSLVELRLEEVRARTAEWVELEVWA